MTILSRNDQSGRSMVEMLGVLAIIGVLSVGGISGYSKAMAKFKLTKAQDQISMLLMNIRTAYATSPSYSGLTSTSAADYNIAPNDMVQTTGTGSTATSVLKGAFGGEVTVGTVKDAPTYFFISMSALGREACRSLLTSDWGADGLISISAGNTTDDEQVTTETGILDRPTVCTGSGTPTTKGDGTWCTANLPVILAGAGLTCTGEQNYITWIYY